MANVSTDHNLLFGLIAMQNGFISRDDLVTATSVWLQDKSLAMDHVLREQGFLSPEQYEALKTLVGLHLDKHDGDAERSLAAVDAISSVRDELCELGDEDVEKTLGHVSQARECASSDETMRWTPPEPGQRFRILRPHAKGGLGMVNVAFDAELNREVALKEIQKEHADNPDSRSRFVQEAEITAGLEHPGIVPVYGLGTHDDNRPYYAMRLIRGDTLKDAIDRFHDAKQSPRDAGRRRLEMRRLMAHFISLCNAIEYAHSRGILHRDIKPSNVMLGKYGETLVVDWGLAKPIGRKEAYRQQDEQTLHPMTSGSSSATKMGSAVGTPSYMSPEQAAGRLDSLGTASDVYSLGATLYCLLTGQPCLPASDAESALRKAQRGDFPSPRSINSNVPRPLESICLKAMATQPEDRYQSAAALAADVERLLADEAVKAHRESFGERLTRLARRHRAWFRAGAATLLLITAGSVVATVLVNAARRDQAHQRIEAEQQLRQSDQLRLAAQAATLQETMPQRALLLASESIESARKNGDVPPQLAFEVLHATLAGSSGSLFARSNASMHYMVLSSDGRWLATGGRGNPTQLWGLEAGATAPSQEIPLGDLPSIALLELSPDGRWLALGDYDGRIHLYDLAAPHPVNSVRQWIAHGGPIFQLVFTPDSGRLVSASTNDEVFKIWNLQQDAPDRDATSIPELFDALTIAVSPDGASLAVSGTGEAKVLVWDISAGGKPRQKLELPLEVEYGIYPAFSPDGRFLALVGNDFAIKIWDLEADAPEDSVRIQDRHSAMSYRPEFTQDGQSLISYSNDGTARLFPVGTRGRDVVLRGHTSAIFTTAMSPSGQLLATGGNDHTIRLWDLESENPNENVQVLRGHDGAIVSLAFSPDGDVLYSGSQDGTVRTWAQQGAQMLTTRRMIRSTSYRRFGGGFFRSFTSQATNGYLVAQLPGGQWRRWNIDAGDFKGERIDIPVERDLFYAEASTDGRWLLSAFLYQQFPTLIDLKNGREKPRILDLDGHEGPVRRTAIDPKSRYVITFGVDGRIVDWDLTARDPSANPETIAQVPGKISSAKVSLDGRWLFAGSDDSTIRRWDLDAADPSASQMVLQGHQNRVRELAVSPDGRQLASASYDLTLRLWQLVDTSRRMDTVEVIQGDFRFRSLSFSPDNRYLVATKGDTGVIHVWDTTAEDVADSDRPLTGHSSGVYEITFSADGRLLATSEMNGNILIWDMSADDPEQTALRLSGHTAPALGLRFFDNNRRLISVSFDATARIWELDRDRLLKLSRKVASRELTDSERVQYGLNPATDHGP